VGSVIYYVWPGRSFILPILQPRWNGFLQ